MALATPGNTAKTPLYGYEDTAAALQVYLRNTYYQCSGPYTSRLFSFDGYLGSSAVEAPIVTRQGSATLDMNGTTFAFLTGTPVTITSILGSYSGKTIRLLPEAAFTLQNNATIVTNTGGDVVLQLNRVYELTFYNTRWYLADAVTVASATYDPPALAPGQRGPTQTVALAGAALGDFAQASFSLASQGVAIEAWVSAAGTVSYYFYRPDADLTGSATYDPPSISDNSTVSTTVTVTGAVLGDVAEAAFSLDLQTLMMTAYVSSANTVTVLLHNHTGGPIDLGSGTLTVRVKPAATIDLASGTVRATITKAV